MRREAADRFGDPVPSARIEFDPAGQIATFTGPGGFTQTYLSEIQASAIAYALGVPFEVR